MGVKQAVGGVDADTLTVLAADAPDQRIRLGGPDRPRRDHRLTYRIGSNRTRGGRSRANGSR